MEALDPDPFDETSDAVCEDERALALTSRGRNGSLVDRGGPDSEVVMTERSAIAIGPGTVLPSQSSLDCDNGRPLGRANGHGNGQGAKDS